MAVKEATRPKSRASAKPAPRKRKAAAPEPDLMKIDEHLSVGGYCSMPEPIPPLLDPGVDGDRAEAIGMRGKLWVNGTRLRYYFFDRASDGRSVLTNDGSTRFMPWAGAEAQKDVVRKAFGIWKKVGIGLEFEEVDNREDAEIRIGFQQGDGAWSFLGKDILTKGKHLRTMNFGWDLTGADGLDTALHEIGHTLGMPHEHQNPNAGIVWDEAAVIRQLSLPPNNWSAAKTRFNILRKIPESAVIGTDWDRNSIMHYPFGPGMILEPTEFRTRALRPAPGLSARDKAWVKETYPKLAKKDENAITAFQSVPLDLQPGAQFNGVFEPEESRKFTIETRGPTDMVLVLFEVIGGKAVFLAGDDDSGRNFNAKIRTRLLKGRRYIIRARLYFSWDQGRSAILVT